MKIALCPGSYDPVTYGHLNVIQRAANLFDQVIVGVMINPAKKYHFSTQERVNMLERVVVDFPNVTVQSYEGLVAEFARVQKADILVKGLRALSDFEYEFQMSLTNKQLNPDLETIFLTTNAEFMYLSSSVVREVACFGGDISAFVPPILEQEIKNRLYKLP